MNAVDKSVQTERLLAHAGQKLRVLFVSHAYVVGINQGKLDAIAATDRVDVGLLVPNNWQAAEWNRQMPVETPYPRIQVYQAPAIGSGRGGAYFYTPWVLGQVVREFQPDIIQVEAEVFSLVAFQLAIWSRITGTPLIVFGWENIERQLPRLRQLTCQFVLNTARALIPGNQDGANILRQWGYRGLLEVMPQMGVDTQFFAPQPRDRQSEFNIGFLGRLVPEKGVDTLFAAARYLKERGLTFRITVCGSGSANEALKQAAEVEQIADRITWEKAIRHQQAPEAISKFDVLVLPSRSTSNWREQFGHVLIEAMAMGVPVIGSDCGEIPNVIGRSDLIFKEEDAKGLTAILERMIREPGWNQHVGSYCLLRARQYYSHEKIAERSIGLWQKLISTHC